MNTQALVSFFFTAMDIVRMPHNAQNQIAQYMFGISLSELFLDLVNASPVEAKLLLDGGDSENNVLSKIYSLLIQRTAHWRKGSKIFVGAWIAKYSFVAKP